MFIRAIRMAVAVNATYVPPVNSGWSMYCRPLLLATSPTLMPGFPEECIFCVYVFLTALGSQADSAPVKALILDDFDRAATRGTGRGKIGTNYAGVTSWSRQASEEGFGITLHLDSVRHEDVDQFSSCGFLGVSKLHIDQVTKYTIVVPDSPSAVVGVTSDSILHIAKSWGWNVVKLRIKYTELNNFSEVIGTGTAVGLIQIRSITRRWSDDLVLYPETGLLRPTDILETFTYDSDADPNAGEVYKKLLAELKGIQSGKIADRFGWLMEVREGDQRVDTDEVD
jgi:branched-chain amino acid aminotransferase